MLTITCREKTKTGRLCKKRHYRDGYCGPHHPDDVVKSEYERNKRNSKFKPFECPFDAHRFMNKVWVHFSEIDEPRYWRPWCDGCLAEEGQTVEELVDSFMEFHDLAYIHRPYVYSQMNIRKQELLGEAQEMEEYRFVGSI